VAEDDAAQLRRPEGGVGDLVGHAEAEGEVGEVGERGVLLLVEVDRRIGTRVVQPRVPEQVDGVHAQPPDGDREQADDGVDDPCRTRGGPAAEHDRDPRQAGEPADDDDDVVPGAVAVATLDLLPGCWRVMAQEVREQRHGEGETGDEEADEQARDQCIGGSEGYKHCDDTCDKRCQ
jgi:hypothetical protein